MPTESDIQGVEDHVLEEALLNLDLDALSATELKTVMRGSEDLEWRKIQASPLRFLLTYALTRDEHRAGTGKEAYQPFPPFLYVIYFVDEWMRNKLQMLPKSRQMIASWLMAGLALWQAMTQNGSLILMQSKKEEDANRLLERVYGIWQRLPEWLKERCPAEQKFCQLRFPKSDSQILGIPQGEHQIRSNTATWWICDEAAFQPEFRGAFEAAQPAIQGGGRATIVSSAKMGPFWEMVESPMVEGTHQVLVPTWSPLNGVETWKIPGGWQIFRIHYSADPRKDEEWAQKASWQLSPTEGQKSAGWQAEMEINPGARAGSRVFPTFSKENHVIPSVDLPWDWPMFVGIDPGFATRCAVSFIRLDGEGTFYVEDELYLKEKSIPEVADMIRGVLARRYSKRWPEGFRIGHDASMRTQAGGGKTKLDQFREHGIRASSVYGYIEQDVAYINSLLELDADGQPKFKVMDRCTNMIWELERYRYEELTDEQLRRRDTPEKPRKKDDHLIDATKNVVCHLPKAYLQYAKKRDRTDKYELLTAKKGRKYQKVRRQGRHARYYDVGV